VVVSLLLGMIVWFSIIVPRRTRGWQDRLHLPNPGEVAARWKVPLPQSLESLYRSAFIGNRDFYLAPPGAGPERWLWIDQFIPLTVRDVAAWRSMASVPGIPIAMDGKDRAYYLSFDDLRRGGPVPVLLHSDGGNSTVVAVDITQLMSFKPRTLAEYDSSYGRPAR
jgi:hypothetical protein